MGISLIWGGWGTAICSSTVFFFSRMAEKPIAAVVVDPYSSGRYLLYELKARNIPIVCVRSSLKLGSFFLAAYDKHKDYFSETIDFQEDLQKLLGQLEALPWHAGLAKGSKERFA